MKSFENSGSLVLTRTEGTWGAGFGILQKTLPELETYLPWLHEAERAYYDQIKADRRKSSYLLGRVAAKMAITAMTEKALPDMSAVHISAGVFKYPVVRSVLHQNVQVSISHCEELGIALAFPEEHPLSIDIERIDAAKTAALFKCIGPKDLEQLVKTALDSITGYSMLWTIKESLSKIIRTGLTMDLQVMELRSFEKEEDYYISTFSHWPQYKTVSFQCNEYVCSVTLPGKTMAAFDELKKRFFDNV